MFVEETEQGLRRELIRCIKLAEVEDAIDLVDRLVTLRVTTDLGDMERRLTEAQERAIGESHKRGAREQELEEKAAQLESARERSRSLSAELEGFVPFGEPGSSEAMTQDSDGNPAFWYGAAHDRPVSPIYYKPSELEQAALEFKERKAESDAG